MLESEALFTWIVLPLLIFAARVFDVSLSTLRIIFVSQGMIRLAPLLGFFEALVWLLVVGKALQYVSNPLCALAYAGGFATGNYVGIKLEEILAMGRRMVRIVLPGGQDPSENSQEDLVARLREEGFGVTVLLGEGLKGPVRILFTIVSRADLPRALGIVERYHPKAFLSVEDVRHASAHSIPLPAGASGWLPWHVLGKSR